jgi:hypothetical protein
LILAAIKNKLPPGHFPVMFKRAVDFNLRKCFQPKETPISFAALVSLVTAFSCEKRTGVVFGETDAGIANSECVRASNAFLKHLGEALNNNLDYMVVGSIAAAMVGTLALGASSPANAGGLLGDIIEGACGNCGVSRALDQINNDLGNPVDHGAAIVCEAWRNLPATSLSDRPCGRR